MLESRVYTLYPAVLSMISMGSFCASDSLVQDHRFLPCAKDHHIKDLSEGQTATSFAH